MLFGPLPVGKKEAVGAEFHLCSWGKATSSGLTAMSGGGAFLQFVCLKRMLFLITQFSYH